MDKRLKYAFDLCSVSTLSLFSNILSISLSVLDLERDSGGVFCFIVVGLLVDVDAVEIVVVGTVAGSGEGCVSVVFKSNV